MDQQPAARAEHSRFVQRVRRRYAAERALLPEGLPDAGRIAALIASVSDDVSAIERDVLTRLATAFGLEPSAVDGALEDVKKSLVA